MRIVITNHAYDDVLRDLYRPPSELAQQSFDEQMAAYYGTLFAASDSYAFNLRELGHEVFEFVLNNQAAQERWLSENEPVDRSPQEKGFVKLALRAFRGRAPSPQPSKSEREFSSLLRQLSILKPDVVFNQSAYAFSTDQLIEIRQHAGALVGEHAAMPLSDDIDFKVYDLIVSSFKPTLDWLTERGVRCALVRLGFDRRLREKISVTQRDVACSFVGSFLPVHSSRFELVEAVARKVPDLEIHGSVALQIKEESPLYGRIRSPLWGRQMFEMLARSEMTLNHHGNVPPYANNMRLYEATGMGALLVTDYKDNLPELFVPDKEVICYRDAEECIDKVLYYGKDEHASERQQIAAAGQVRTFKSHTYRQRMAELSKLLAEL